MDTKGYVKAAQVPAASIPLVGFLYLQSGEMLLEISQKSFLISAGHLLLIPKGQTFSVHYYSDAVGYSGGFSLSLVPQSMAAVLLVEPLQHVFWFEEGSFTGELMSMLLQAFERDDIPYIEKGLELLLMRVQSGGAPAMPGLVSAFIDLLFSEDTAPAGLNDYASRLGVSSNYLSRVVKKSTRRTVGEWIDIARLGRAKRLLKDSSMPIIDIAMAVGLEDQSYFSRWFKRMSGRTPTEFRRCIK